VGGAVGVALIAPMAGAWIELTRGPLTADTVDPASASLGLVGFGLGAAAGLVASGVSRWLRDHGAAPTLPGDALVAALVAAALSAPVLLLALASETQGVGLVELVGVTMATVGVLAAVAAVAGAFVHVWSAGDASRTRWWVGVLGEAMVVGVVVLAVAVFLGRSLAPAGS
jgi:hypothetical protein